MTLRLPFELAITNKDDAGKLLRSRKLLPRWVISLGAPTTKPPPGWGKFAKTRKLRLEFDDIDRPGHAWYVAPDTEDIVSLLRFGQRIDHGKLLIHCAAGISRSTASAFTLVTQVLGPGSEVDAIDYIYRIRSIARPNELIVKYADALLDRKGAMIEADRAKRESVLAKKIAMQHEQDAKLDRLAT